MTRRLFTASCITLVRDYCGWAKFTRLGEKVLTIELIGKIGYWTADVSIGSSNVGNN
jgi:hypothetical protein